MRRRLVRAVLVPLVLLATGCRGGTPSPPQAATAGVVVASFDFDESRLLAEIYAQALEDEGVAVRREVGLGPRELVLPAMRASLVDVVPEYAGAALDAASTGPPVATADRSEVVAALAQAVAPWDLTPLTPSRASNQNVLAVSTALAREHDLRSVSDLRSIGEPLVLGGPAECPRRPRCLPGYEARYGLRFRYFVPLAGAELVARALADDVVDVGLLFSTDAALAGGDLVALTDDRFLQPPDVVVPLVRTAVLDDERIAAALDEVSAELTTEGLRFVNWRLVNAGTTPAAEARGWLLRHGLVAR